MPTHPANFTEDRLGRRTLATNRRGNGAGVSRFYTRGSRRVRSGDAIIRIAIGVEAFEAIASTLPLGSVVYENAINERRKRPIWLAPDVIKKGRVRPIACGLRTPR